MVVLRRPPGISKSTVEGGIEALTGGPVGGFSRVAGRGFGRVGRTLRGIKFRASPKQTPPVKGGIISNPIQAGDDVARQLSGPATSVPPAAGRAGSRQFPTSFVVKAGVLGGAAVAAPPLLRNLTQPVSQLTGPQGPVGEAGRTITEFTTDLFESLGLGLANIGAGTGAGAGAGLAGIAVGLRKLVVPGLLLGGLVVAFLFVSGQAPKRRRT